MSAAFSFSACEDCDVSESGVREKLHKILHLDLPRLSGEKEFAEVDSNKEQGNKMSRRNKHHTDEFKAEAVELVEDSGKSVPEIAEDLGINARTLYHWLAAQKPKEDTRNGASEGDLIAENKRLRRELEIMRQERDILKKAMGVFTKESR